MTIKLLASSVIIALAISGQGCASGSEKLESRADYRQAQVEAIKVQREADVAAQQALSDERVAMWDALSEAVKANPDSASNLAIVAAVASSRSDSGTVTTGSVTTLTPERDVQAIDYVKVLAPGLVSGLTQAGISAIANETTRASIKANRDVRISEIENVDGALVSAVAGAISSSSNNNNNDSDGDVIIVDPADTLDPDAGTDPDGGDDDGDDDGTDFYNDDESDCSEGQVLVQTTWGSQCQ